MKSFLEKSKRALVLLLTGAMIATSVPADIFAAPLADEDVIFEDGADTVEALGAEEAVTDEELVVEEAVDPVDPDLSYSDVKVQLNVTNAISADWISAGSEVSATAAQITTDSGIKGRVAYADINSGDKPSIITLPDNSNKQATVVGDSENGYQVYLYVQEGFVFADKPVTEVSYDDYRTKNYSAAAEKTTAVLSDTPVTTTDTGKKYSVEKVNDRTMLLTIPSGLMKDAIAATYYKDYKADEAPANTWYVASPTIKISIAEAYDLKSRILPLPTVDSSTEHLDDIDNDVLTAEWVVVGTSPSSDAWTLTDLDDFITNKTLTADMIKVTFTVKNGTPITFTASSDPIDQTTVGSENYVQYTGGNLSIASSLINEFVYDQADLTIAIDGSGAAAKEKNISVIADDTFAKVLKKGGKATDLLNGTKYNISDGLEFDVNVGTGTRTVKEIEVKENTDGTVFKIGSGVTETAIKGSTHTYSVAGIDDDVTITVTTQEAVGKDSTSDADISLYAANGAPLEKADSGKALTFEIRPGTGRAVKSVSYKIGSAGTLQTIALTSNNTYTIAENIITDKLYIKAESYVPDKDSLIIPVLDASQNESALLTASHLAKVSAGEDVSQEFDTTARTTEVVDGYYGQGTGFLTYWNSKYPKTSADALDTEKYTINGSGTWTKVDGVTSSTTDTIVALTIEVDNSDWDANATHCGIYAENATDSTKNTWTINQIAQSQRVVTGSTSYVTLFWNETVNGILSNLSVGNGDTIVLQPFVVTVNSADRNISDDEAESLSTMLGHPLDFDLNTSAGTFTQSSFVWSSPKNAIAGKYFFFTVEPTDDSYMATAKYRFAHTGEWTDAVYVTEGDDAGNPYYVFRTDVVTGDVLEINAAGVKGASIFKPENARVDVNFSDGVVVPTNEDFYFTVTPKTSTDSTIKIDKVQWSNTGSAPATDANVLTPDASGKYRLAAGSQVLGAANSAMDVNGIQIYVYTTETMNQDAYTATFKVSNEDDKTVNPRLVNTKDTSGKITAQKLFVEYGDDTSSSGYLTADFKTAKRVPVDAGTVDDDTITEGAAGFYPNKYKTNGTNTDKDIVTLSGSAGSVLVTGNNIGTDKITATLKNTSANLADAASTYNTVVYTADLDVEVTAAYTDLEIHAYDELSNEATTLMADSTENDAGNNNRVVYFGITGKNARTGEREDVNSSAISLGGAVEIDWSFEPDNKAVANATKLYKMDNSNIAFSAMAGDYVDDSTDCSSNQYNESGVCVRANSADASSVTVVATCKIAGQTKATVLKKKINIIDDAAYVPFATVKVQNKEKEEYGWAVDDGITADADILEDVYDIDDQELELVSNGQNSLTLNYDMYKRISTSQSAATDSDALKELTDAVEYAKVTEGVTWDAYVENYDPSTYSYKKDSTDKTEYIKLESKGNGAFEITAKAKTPTNEPRVRLTVYKDNVVIANDWFYVTVDNAFERGEVRLILDDEANYTLNDAKTESTPVQLAVNSDKYTSKASSIIESNTTTGYTEADLITKGDGFGDGVVSIRGIAYTSETIDGTFTLPTQDDFDQDKIAANQVLVYWQKVNNTWDGTKAALAGKLLTTENDYFYPGEEVTVNTDPAKNVYKAVWKPKYTFRAEGLAADGTDLFGKGLEVYNGNLEVKDGEGNITGYGTAFASVDDAAALTSDVTGQIAAGGSIPLVLAMNENIPYSKDNKAAVHAKVLGGGSFATEFGKVVAGKKYVYSADLSVEQKGTNANKLQADKGTISTKKTAGTVSSGLTITVSWNEGNKTYTTAPLDVNIVADQKYTLEINGGEAKTLLSDQINNNTVDVVLKKNDVSEPVGNVANYTFKWKSSDETVATVETSAGTGDVISTGTITPLKAGNTTLTLTVIDGLGTSVEATCALTVADNGVVFTIKDPDGNEIDLSKDEPIFAKARNTGTSGVNTGYTISAEPAVSWGSVTGDATIIAASNNSIDANSKIYVATVAGKELSDDGYVLVQYKKSGDATTTFQKKINVSTYYPITIHSDDTTGDKKFVVVDGTKVTGTAGAAKDYEFKVTTANIEDNTAASFKYTGIDLSKYASVYEGTQPKDFLGWATTPGGTSVVFETGSTITAKFAKDATIGSGVLNQGTVTLYPLFGDKAIESVTVAQNTITLSNETGANIPSGLSNTKAFTLTVEPYDTKAELVLVPDKAMLYRSTKTNAGGVLIGTAGAVGITYDPAATEQTLGADGKIKLEFGTSSTDADDYDGAVVINETGKKRTDHFSIATISGAASRAGTVVFDVQSNKKSLEKITVYINGYDKEDDAYYEAGEKVVSDSRLVGGVTWFFDEDGKHITGDKIITKADGTKIAIVGGEVASAGKASIDGATYVVGSNGVLVTGWITKTWTATTNAAEGLYYADPEADGKLVSNTIKKVGDKSYYFKANQEKAVASAEANLYEAVGDYYVNTAGEIALGDIFKVAGVDRLFKENGAIVSYADTVTAGTPGKMKVGNIGYVIDPTTNAATRDDILYNATVTWTVGYPTKISKGSPAPELKYTITYTSKNTGETTTTEAISVTSVPNGDFSNASTATELTFTATPDLTGYFADAEGKTPATAAAKTITYRFKDGGAEGISDVWYAPSVTWTTKWANAWTKSEAIPSMKYTVTYTSKESGKQVTTDELTASITPTTVASDATEVTFVATADLSAYYTDETGATAVDPTKIAKSTTSKTYKFKNGGESGTSGQDISGGAGIEIQELEEEYPYTGNAVKPGFRVYDAERDAYLAYNTDYTVTYTNNKAAGKATVTIKGKGNYTGTSASAEFTIVDPTADLDKDNMANTVKKVILPKATYTYTGAPLYPATITVKTADAGDIVYTLGDDGEYTAPDGSKEVGISVTNNINAGKATVAAIGKDGTAKFTGFTIGKADISTAEFTIDEALWGQKAIETGIAGTFGEDAIDLIGNGGDFKATFKAPNAGTGAGSVKIVGKNNFKGSKTVAYDVATFDISEDDIVVTAFTGNKVKAVKVQVLDKAGNPLNKKNYSFEIKDGEGNALDKTAPVPSEITVVVKGAGTNVKTDDDGVSKTVAVGANLAKVKGIKVDKNFAKIYTGEPVTLDEEDFGVGKIVVPTDYEFGTDFIVAGYQNNIKKGTMKVTLQGISEKCSGTKVIKVKIAAKPIKAST